MFPRPLTKALRVHLPSRLRYKYFHTAPFLNSASRPGLTNMLASEVPPSLQVTSVTPFGVLLADGRLFPSACILLESKAFLWEVPPGPLTSDTWGTEHFEIFETVVPRPGEEHRSAQNLL